MALAELLANNLVSNMEMLKQHLADFTEEEMLVRPVPTANHAAWQVGHLAFLEVSLCGIYAPSAGLSMPADAATTYGKAGASSDDPARFFRKDEGLKMLADASTALVGWIRALADADFAQPSPEFLRGWVPTVGDLVVGMIGHRAMHIGQFQVLRRKLGKKILF